MKKIQLNLKKRDRDNLKHMSNTYEDTHMKESSKLKEDVNPDVFLMNLQVKNKDNEHLFNMDFSEFLPTVRKKEEPEVIEEKIKVEYKHEDYNNDSYDIDNNGRISLWDYENKVWNSDIVPNWVSSDYVRNFYTEGEARGIGQGES